MDELAAMMQEFPPSMETLRQMKFPSIKQILADLPRVELLSRPGKQVEYSNLGIALLAHVLERVTGQEYTTYVERQILQPLGMQHSGFSSTVRASVNTAVCYLPFSSPPQAAPFETKIINGFTPTGALWSSVGDMSRLMAFMTGAQDAHPARILSRSALLEMTGMVVPLEHSRYTGTAAPGGVGIGWFLTEVRGQLVAEHGGADPSTAAYIAWVPALDLAAFAATNTGKNPAAVAAAVSTLLEWIIVDIHESRI
jgi:CubicO group peptidase (beta-lactamase class C family)